MADLSIIMPTCKEMFLNNTVENILENIEADTEIIVISDGCWPDLPLPDHERVILVHHTKSIGQRAGTNEGARISQAKYIMKLDAHCAVGKGFDRILIEDCEPDWTMIPLMWNLHAFDWVCTDCGNRIYQGNINFCGENTPDDRHWTKEGCGSTSLKMVIVWKPRSNKKTVSWRFDKDLRFKYWRKHRKRPECKGDLIETMSCIGACFFMPRKRFWELGGMDEAHGSWGQFGTELACKTWLSGGKMITSKKTWFGHMFRTGNFRGAFGKGGSFPYPMSDKAQEQAKEYSKDLWLNDKWDKAVHPLSWLVERFKPVPDWHDDIK